jgi:hypothetical protein
LSTDSGGRALGRVLLVALLVACAKAEDAPPAHESRASDRRWADSSPLAEARATVEARYAAHWRTDQGFSRDTLRARESWFTPSLYQLLLADMSEQDIGVLDHDPFSDAQDVAERYMVGTPRSHSDTVYVPIEIEFAAASDSRRRLTIAMVHRGSSWQIGDFIDKSGSLAARLRQDPPVQAAAQDTAGCELSRHVAHPDPDALLREFVSRDSAGQFTQSTDWFTGAVDCPGHEPGPDEAIAVRGYEIRELVRSDSAVQSEVRWDRVGPDGAAIPGAFAETLTVIRTPFGWRVRSPALNPKVPAPNASRAQVDGRSRPDA